MAGSWYAGRPRRSHESGWALLPLARIGYVARGLVYLLIAWPTAEAALGARRLPSLRGVLAAFPDQPLGSILLAAISLGLLAFSIWRLLQALFGQTSQELWRRICWRGSMLISAALHLALAGTAAAVLAHQRGLLASSLERGLAQVFAAAALHWPLGRWIVGLVGSGAIAMGIGQLVKARRAAFDNIRAGSKAMVVIQCLGRLGLCARGFVFGMIGGLFLHAAWHAEAEEAGGLQAMLQFIADAPLGSWMLLGTAAGLATFGAFSLVKSWYHAPVPQLKG